MRVKLYEIVGSTSEQSRVIMNDHSPLCSATPRKFPGQ